MQRKNNILIIVSNYYEEISNNLLKETLNEFANNNFNYTVETVTGVFEIPSIITFAKNKFDGYVALGCVIRGETYHFDLIANECARKIIDISNASLKPIGFGVLTCDNLRQAIVRSDVRKKNKGKEAANACIKLL